MRQRRSIGCAPSLAVDQAVGGRAWSEMGLAATTYRAPPENMGEGRPRQAAGRHHCGGGWCIGSPCPIGRTRYSRRTCITCCTTPCPTRCTIAAPRYGAHNAICRHRRRGLHRGHRPCLGCSAVLGQGNGPALPRHAVAHHRDGVRHGGSQAGGCRLAGPAMAPHGMDVAPHPRCPDLRSRRDQRHPTPSSSPPM